MPRPGPGGPRGGAPAEKAKNFKGAVKRLFIELKSFRVLIVIALILAILSSILSIVAPNQLSELTDVITQRTNGKYGYGSNKEYSIIFSNSICL